MKKTAKIKEKLAGVVTHFYGNLKVAVVKVRSPFGVGSEINIRGASTDFKQIAESIQFNHKAINKVSKGKSIGLKVKKRVREGDQVYILQ